ncbi:caspase family protein [Calothrix sp. PCC 6303]|uniref:caspase family protein n=1 Tax=Calothrix sp. PCC 6303 TaxID=1170562 RepID=UPI0002A03DF9|nr:caspase family protein [Calothrix sp. PCC 6303]AFY99664.1 peptidase C14 caspase catalytic subunit p20 [Calothrix sp. PCC 6303]
MSPLGVGISHSALTLQSGESKLWILLVGVNEYQDRGLPSLRYPALDCQGLGDALAKATQGFPNKEVIVHNDFAPQAPMLETVRGSVERLVTQARSQDTILLYFSGHGMLESRTQEAFLCLKDTNKNDLRGTGLGLQDLLQLLGSSRACQQLICLDTCHSGDMMLRGHHHSPAPRDGNITTAALNTTTQFMQVLRERASQSKGFCALLSCDQGQQSWEFPELGHGVFTYYLMRGLLGEAADERGLIEADGLYKYVYRHTLQYINNLNQQVRLINQQKRNRGDSQLYPEYPQQTPKRIVEGVGELILGYRSAIAKIEPQRQALVIDGLTTSTASPKITEILHGAGGFEVESFPDDGKNWSDVRAVIQRCLRWQGKPNTSSSYPAKDTPTTLLYLRGKIEEIEDGEAWLVLGDGVRLSRSWLRQELRRCSNAQQIMILDCPGATSLEDWLEDLRLGSQQGQCLIAAASPDEDPDFFAKVIFNTLSTANSHLELPIAAWVNQLQKPLQEKGIDVHVWLSGCQSVIDILPGNISHRPSNSVKTPVQEQPIKNTPVVKNKPEKLPDLNATRVNFCAIPQLQELGNIRRNNNFLIPNSEPYKQLQQILMQLAGPIAPTLLQRVLAKSETPTELVGNLASHLLPNQQANFQRQAMVILEPPMPKMKTPPPELLELDVVFIKKCERELIDLIGPIGGYLVERIMRSHPQILPTELVKRLADEIPDPKTAWEFQRRFPA